MKRILPRHPTNWTTGGDPVRSGVPPKCPFGETPWNTSFWKGRFPNSWMYYMYFIDQHGPAWTQIWPSKLPVYGVYGGVWWPRSRYFFRNFDHIEIALNFHQNRDFPNIWPKSRFLEKNWSNSKFFENFHKSQENLIKFENFHKSQENLSNFDQIENFLKFCPKLGKS